MNSFMLYESMNVITYPFPMCSCMHPVLFLDNIWYMISYSTKNIYWFIGVNDWRSLCYGLLLKILIISVLERRQFLENLW